MMKNQINEKPKNLSTDFIRRLFYFIQYGLEDEWSNALFRYHRRLSLLLVFEIRFYDAWILSLLFWPRRSSSAFLISYSSYSAFIRLSCNIFISLFPLPLCSIFVILWTRAVAIYVFAHFLPSCWCNWILNLHFFTFHIQ